MSSYLAFWGLNCFRQWAGEKISLRDKSVVGDEMKELEQDIELRKQGILRYVLFVLSARLCSH